MSKTMKRVALAFPSGEYIAEELACRGISEQVFASQMGWDTEHATAVLHGDRALLSDDINKIAAYFGTSAELWHNLQAVRFDYLCRTIAAKQAGVSVTTLKQGGSREQAE